MKRFLTIFFFVLSAAINAQEVSYDDIVRTADEFTKIYFPGTDYSVASVVPETTDNSISFFIVNLQPEGWLIISGTKKVRPVLGFNFTGSHILPDSSKNNTEYNWLEGYRKQIEDARKTLGLEDNPAWKSTAVLKSKSAKDDPVNVANLINVKWDQGRNWNMFCPEDPDGPGGHVYVGCVAVAMAQAMSVYMKPQYGEGSKDYLNDTYGLLSVDFASTNYKWDSMSLDMADQYNALLLYHCAVSVDMDFGPDGSGALTALAKIALRDYFRMSKEMTYYRRDRVSNWKELITLELVEGRPIIYKGDADNGEAGHAFNLDGVINSDYFHINWGWSGSSNGYFLLDDLTPGTNNFTQNHAAIFGMQPFYYPTGVELSSYIVPEGVAAGASVGEIIIIDEAIDNEYEITLISDSTYISGSWYKDYYIDGDTLRTGVLFPEEANTTDTIWFQVSDIHDNYIEAEVVLVLGDTSTSSTGILEERLQSLVIYPNPVSDILRIQTGTGELVRSVKIYSMDGSILRERYLYGQSIEMDVSSLRPGFYILGLDYTDGIIIRRKFIRR